MQKEIGERAWSVQVFTLPELWTGPLRGSDENKLWTEKIIMIRRLNLSKRRNKICTFFHLLCLMNIKKQTSLGKFKYNLNQTPMPLLFCKPLNWKARLGHAEETLANQHDPRNEFKSSLIVILKPSCWQLLLSGSNTNAQTCEVNFVAKWVLK